MEEETKKFNISTTLSFLNMGKKLKKIAEDSKTSSQKYNKETTQKVMSTLSVKHYVDNSLYFLVKISLTQPYKLLIY